MYCCPFLQNQHLFFYKKSNRLESATIHSSMYEFPWPQRLTRPGQPPSMPLCLAPHHTVAGRVVSSEISIAIPRRSSLQPSECPPPWSIWRPYLAKRAEVPGTGWLIDEASRRHWHRRPAGDDHAWIANVGKGIVPPPWLWAALPCYLSSKSRVDIICLMIWLR